MIDNSNSIFVDNEKQNIVSIFTSIMATAGVLLCFDLVRKWK